LRQRVSGGELPEWRIVDLRDHPLEEGISAPVFKQLDATLARGEQALVFLNRRGYAPVVMCHHCGAPCDCRRCEAHMVLHRNPRILRCHRCGLTKPVPRQCSTCDGLDLRGIGEGTERLDELFQQRFPDTPILRFDRDSTRRKDALETMSTQVRSGEPCILVGTQMLAKGHHFPGVSLAVILNVDQALYSADFRAMERLGQLMTQVAGRAGRGETAGVVLLQTYHPEHPFLEDLTRFSYAALARDLLQERKDAHLPPYSHHCVLRAECHQHGPLDSFLATAAELAKGHTEVEVFGPLAAIQPIIAGRQRMQIMIQANTRGAGTTQRFPQSALEYRYRPARVLTPGSIIIRNAQGLLTTPSSPWALLPVSAIYT
jgi:primosomal protein N' (replication factor Y)